MKRPVFTGTCTALITPFTPSGVDVKALARIVDWQIEQGVNASWPAAPGAQHHDR